MSAAEDRRRRRIAAWLREKWGREPTEAEIDRGLDWEDRIREERQEAQRRGDERRRRIAERDNAAMQARIIARALSASPSQRTRTARADKLTTALQSARATLLVRLGREPTASEVIARLERDDPTGAVVDFTDERITRADEAGVLHDTARSSIANRLTRLRQR